MYRIANGNKNGLEAPSLVVIDDGNELVYVLLKFPSAFLERRLGLLDILSFFKCRQKFPPLGL